MNTSYIDRKAWCTPSDLTFHSSPASAQKISASADPLQHAYHHAMIQLIRKEIAGIEQYISIPYAFFLTDCSGRLLEFSSSSADIRAEMEQMGFGIGKSLAKDTAGLNAVSLSMEMNRLAVVKGEEHSNPALQRWNCVCAPVQLDGSVRGYLDISFLQGQQIEFAIPFVRQIVSSIAGKWMSSTPDLQQYNQEIVFIQYRLTRRERDVAQLWSLEKSALYISNELGISEGTVRNMVKSIYLKMKVNDRSQFVKRLVRPSDEI
ncbi:helix-turn-helix domain-containing protein [Paenibacillus tengchongensis]|uniref:helix-turn-helix domain-containing protein n=1 Tax=Paenibacillus tengchongensis TaxID=2608684 RepID=UPI00124E99B2|nr:helix-turn-helix transcriptional regulator [Paenibacillus tengchongensis]